MIDPAGDGAPGRPAIRSKSYCSVADRAACSRAPARAPGRCSRPSRPSRPASVTTNEGRPSRVIRTPWSPMKRAGQPGPGMIATGHGQRVRGPQADHRADGRVEPDRQVDLAEQQHEDLRHAEQDERHALGHQVDQVARGKEQRVLDLEEHHDRDQAEDDRQRAALPVPDPPPPDARVLADGVRPSARAATAGRGQVGGLRRRSAGPGPARSRRWRPGPARRCRSRMTWLSLPCRWPRAAIPHGLAAAVADPGRRPVVISSTADCVSKSEAGPTAASRPRYSTAIRSATWKTSVRLCEITSTAVPAAGQPRRSG